MRFLNPKTGFAFKKIFGSEHSADILLSFLNAVLGLEHPHKIIEIDLLDPYLAPKIQGMKDTFLDIRAKDEQDKTYIIEMQVEERLRIARSLLNVIQDDAVIAGKTELSLEAIQRLRDEKT